MMMDKVKYVVMDGGLSEDIVIFADTMKHSDMADHLPGKVLSAGFVKIDWEKKKLVTYGGSVSLGLSSRPKDSLLANYMFFSD